MALSSRMINAILTQHFIRSTSIDALSLYSRSLIGEKKEGAIEYSPVEALFLIKSNKMQFIQQGKPLSQEKAIAKIKRQDKEAEQKCIVFSNLHKKGYIVKEGLKFGGDFRVYKSKEQHARWIVFVTSDRERLDWRDFAAKNRVAHSSNKKILLALIDSEGDVNYYEVGWIKP